MDKQQKIKNTENIIKYDGEDNDDKQKDKYDRIQK